MADFPEEDHGERKQAIEQARNLQKYFAGELTAYTVSGVYFDFQPYSTFVLAKSPRDAAREGLKQVCRDNEFETDDLDLDEDPLGELTDALGLNVHSVIKGHHNEQLDVMV